MPQHADAHDNGCGCAGCCGAVSATAPVTTAAAPAGAVAGFSGGAGFMSPAGVAFLQRSAGNAAVGAMLARRAATPVLARRGLFGGAETDEERYADAIEEKQEYISEGMRGPEDFQSSTGIGGFNVSYEPSGWELAVLLKGAVTFLDGMELQGGRAVPKQPHANAQAAADAINLMAADQRAGAVAGWQWAADAKTAFLARFQSVVAGVWSGEHIFHCSEEYWEDMAAIPSVSAEVHEGEKADDDHVAMSIYKVPPNFVGGVGVVNSGGGFFGIGAATDNTMTLNSNDVEQRADDVLNVSTSFTADASTLASGTGPAITQFAIRFRSGGPLCGMCGNAIEAVGGVAISATVEGDGADPEARARERFDALSAALVTGGMADAPTRLQFAYGGVGTNAQLRVGNGVPQIVAAHEAGHMFGLGDRYATTAGSGVGGTGPSAGLPSRHDQLSRDGGLGDAKAANDDGIMSFGNEVRPADYATFLEALKEVSGKDEWEFGPPRAVVAPGGASWPGGSSPDGPGDFPTPPRNPTAAVG